MLIFLFHSLEEKEKKTYCERTTLMVAQSKRTSLMKTMAPGFSAMLSTLFV